MNKKELFEYLIGEGSIERFMASLIFAYIGAFVMLLLNTTKRDPLSPTSPTNFSWRYLWNDNNRRVIATVILIFIAVRFGRDWIGSDITMYVAFGIGLGCDRLSQLFKEKNILKIGQ